MGINANETFGNTRFGASFGSQPKADQKNAQLWMNVGYQTEVPGDNEGETETLFVSLPFGIPLDTQDAFDLSKVNNANMAELRQAQNELLEQVMDAANALEPGEERIIAADPKTGLAVQIRRRKAAATAPAEGENRLAKKLKIAA